MQARQIKEGKVYAAKVSNRLVPVRVDRINPHSHYRYQCTNLATNRQVNMRTAARFRFEVERCEDGKWRRVT